MDLKWLFAESNVKLANYRLCKNFDTLGVGPQKWKSSSLHSEKEYPEK